MCHQLIHLIKQSQPPSRQIPEGPHVCFTYTTCQCLLVFGDVAGAAVDVTLRIYIGLRLPSTTGACTAPYPRGCCMTAYTTQSTSEPYVTLVTQPESGQEAAAIYTESSLTSIHCELHSNARVRLLKSTTAPSIAIERVQHHVPETLGADT